MNLVFSNCRKSTAPLSGSPDVCVVRDVDADALLARFLPTDLPGRFGSPVFSQAMNEN